jgi:uncharacterized membrane protein
MKSVKVIVEIAAPAQRVFQTLCDVERWPEWTPTMQSVQRLDSGPFKVGSRARVVQPKLRPSLWEVSSMDEDRNFNWLSATPGLRMDAGHAVESVAGGCRVTLTFALSGLLSPLVSLLYGGLIATYVNTEAEGLKRHCEI